MKTQTLVSSFVHSFVHHFMRYRDIDDNISFAKEQTPDMVKRNGKRNSTVTRNIELSIQIRRCRPVLTFIAGKRIKELL